MILRRTMIAAAALAAAGLSSLPALAAEELKTPLGYEWHEAHTGVAERKMAAANNNNNPPPKPAAPPKGLAPPKPKRPLANL